MQAQALRGWWDELPSAQRFLLGKLIGGGFRIGVSRLQVQRAIAVHAGLDPKLVAQRLVGWTDARHLPTADRLLALLAPADATPAAATGQPFPFFLAHAVPAAPADFAQALGPVSDWLAEWKYDGIRAQVVCQAGQVWIWSRGEELISERFPEVVAAAQGLPDGTVLDGELLVWTGGAPAPFNQLQLRLNRKTLSRKLRSDAPVRFNLDSSVSHSARRPEPAWIWAVRPVFGQRKSTPWQPIFRISPTAAPWLINTECLCGHWQQAA